MSIDESTAARVAKLARIKVEPDALPALAQEFNNILGFIEQLNEVDVDGVEPMTSVTPQVLKKREDVVRDGDQQAKVGQPSGGERNRVHLAKMLKSEANVLLLDEPTNDLDVETLRALEDAIENFAGCAVVISHDRFFLDRLATHILAFEGNSHVEWFEGNFEAYEEDKRRRLGDAADRPTRLAYKKLTR